MQPGDLKMVRLVNGSGRKKCKTPHVMRPENASHAYENNRIIEMFLQKLQVTRV